MTRVFPSKKDTWIMIVLIGALAIGATGTLIGVLSGKRGAILIGAVAWVFVIGIFRLLVFPMRYELADHELIIQFGVVRLRLPYTAITSVVPTRNPLSSPALSLDRLRIDYQKGSRSTSVMISPDPKREFVSELGRLAGLTATGDGLSRPA